MYLSLCLGALLLIIVYVWLRLGYILFRAATKPGSRKRTEFEASEHLRKMGYDPKASLGMYKGFGEITTIKSTFAEHVIPVEIIYPEGKPVGIVVLAHGYTADRSYWYPVLPIYLKRQYICVVYDQRNTAGNTANRFAFGFLEKFDLKDVVAYAKAILGTKLPVVVHGVSLGSATVGFYLGQGFAKMQGIAGAIMDCPFSTIADAFVVQCKQLYRYLPAHTLIASGSIWNRIYLKFWYHHGSVTEAVAKADCPTYVIYSDEDKICPGWQGKLVAEAVPAKWGQTLHLTSGRHARLQFDQADLYESGIASFLSGIVQAD